MATESPPRRRLGKVIVVLPAYNEEENLGALLQSVDEVMHDSGWDYCVVVVDDGSSDGTVQVAQQHAALMPIQIEKHETNKGLGVTIRDGLWVAAQMCDGRDIVVAMDADNTHLPALIPRMKRRIDEGNDVVIASRYRQGSSVLGVPPHRLLFSIGVRYLFQIAFPIHGVRDYSCGYRAYRGEVLQNAFEKYGDRFVDQQGFQCMVDILIKLHKIGVIICEVPMVLRYDLKGGVSKMNVTRTILQTLVLMVRRRFGL